MATFYRAVVCSNQDPQNQGRVQVRYLQFEGESEDKPSEWASLCQPYASSGSGMFFLPEKNDEVLVYLEGGDLEHPTVLGTLYTGNNKPPVTDKGSHGNSDGKNNLKFIRTRSGHILSFDDSSESNGILIQDSKGSKFHLNAQQESLEITDKNSNRISMEGDKVIVENSKGARITISGEKIEVESKSITLSAEKVSVEKANSIELGSGASEALIKGQSFMQLFNAHTHMCAPGASSPPTSPMTPAMLSQKVKTA